METVSWKNDTVIAPVSYENGWTEWRRRESEREKEKQCNTTKAYTQQTYKMPYIH